MKPLIKIPTLLGLFLTVLIIGALVYVSGGPFRSEPKASGSQTPAGILQTNISDTTFTITWLTDSPATGTLLVSSPNKKNQVYYDERDLTGTLGKYLTHSITVRDARPNTPYTYKILSDGKAYTNGDKPYSLTTPSELSSGTNGMDPAYGTILSPTGVPVEGALVFLTLEGGQQFSSVTKSSGLWLIPLNQTRTGDLSGYLPVAQRMVENITVRIQNMESTAVTDTLNDSPVPEIYLGKSYDFRKVQAKSSPPVFAQTVATEQSVLGESTVKTYSVSLTQPKDGAHLSTPLPLIAGTGIPGKFVGISLGIQKPQSGSAKVDADGLWKFTPVKRLSAGAQSVTILTTDAAGKAVAITHSFEILKDGTQVLGSATPSATLMPTETPLPTAAETPSVTPPEQTTTTPESSLSGQNPPHTGNQLPVIILVLAGFGIFLGGMVVAFRY